MPNINNSGIIWKVIRFSIYWWLLFSLKVYQWPLNSKWPPLFKGQIWLKCERFITLDLLHTFCVIYKLVILFIFRGPIFFTKRSITDILIQNGRHFPKVKFCSQVSFQKFWCINNACSIFYNYTANKTPNDKVAFVFTSKALNSKWLPLSKYQILQT